MRKQNRYIANGAVIGFGAIALIDVLIQWFEHLDRGEKFTWDSYDGKRTLKNGLVGGTVGASIGYVYYNYETSVESREPFNSDEYLRSILRSEDLKNNGILLNKAVIFRDKLKSWVINDFGDKLASLPETTGSFAKRTANISEFDVDILLPFKKDSFKTLEEMYEWTYARFKSKFGNQAIISKQTKAISIAFERGSDSINFDIVPGREINNYRMDRQLNLFVNTNSIWKRNSSFKVDTLLQRNITMNKPEARRVIRLLKIYNMRNSLNVPKVIIEQGVVEALSNREYGTYSSNTDNLLNSMKYLADKLEQNYYADSGNTNNNLNNKATYSERHYACSLLRSDVEKIESNQRYVKEIFET